MTDLEGRDPHIQDKAALEALSQKLKAAKARDNPDRAASENDLSGMSEGLKYASEFSAAVLVGAAFGWMVDKFAGSSPWGLLIGLFLGLCAGILNVVRAARDGMDGSGDDLPPEPYEDEDL